MDRTTEEQSGKRIFVLLDTHVHGGSFSAGDRPLRERRFLPAPSLRRRYSPNCARVKGKPQTCSTAGIGVAPEDSIAVARNSRRRISVTDVNLYVLGNGGQHLFFFLRVLDGDAVTSIWSLHDGSTEVERNKEASTYLSYHTSVHAVNDTYWYKAVERARVQH